MDEKILIDLYEGSRLLAEWFARGAIPQRGDRVELPLRDGASNAYRVENVTWISPVRVRLDLEWHSVR